MTAFHIKLIAIITMLIDHVGLFFFPESFLLRTIGRLSFPLFAWLIANGAYHTRDINKYFIRLLILAVASQIPFMLANRFIDPYGFSLNIFFTLSIGLGAIILMKKTTSKLLWFLIALICAITASLLNTDYGGFGVLSIIAFFVYFKNKKTLIVSQVWIYVLMAFHFLAERNTLWIIELFGLLSLIFIFLYNNKEGFKMQYLFYLIYPVHYVVIYLLLQMRLF